MWKAVDGALTVPFFFLRLKWQPMLRLIDSAKLNPFEALRVSTLDLQVFL